MIKEVIKFQKNDNEFQLQKCLNWVYSVTQSLRIYFEKGEFQTWNSALTKFTQDALIGLVPLFPHFEIFIRTCNWNHYCRIRVNVVSLESWFLFFFTQIAKIWGFETRYMQNFVKIKKLVLFGPKSLNLDVWAQNFSKQMSNLKSAPS